MRIKTHLIDIALYLSSLWSDMSMCRRACLLNYSDPGLLLLSSSEVGGSPGSGSARWTEDRGSDLLVSLVQETGGKLWSRRVSIKAAVIQLNKITKP